MSAGGSTVAAGGRYKQSVVYALTRVASHGLPDESYICDGMQAACKSNGLGMAATALFLEGPVKTCIYLPAGALLTAVHSSRSELRALSISPGHAYGDVPQLQALPSPVPAA
jgi:hypothetical protein